MLRLNLNMLSPEKKKKLSSLITLAYIKDIAGILAIFASLVAISLLWSWNILAEKFGDLSANAVSITRETSDFSRDIRKINNIIHEINLAGVKHAVVMPEVAEAIEKTPADIVLGTIALNRETQSFEIDGIAASRDALLNFEKTLNTVGWLTRVSAPRSQLFKKNDVQFTIRAALKGIPVPPNYIAPTNIPRQTTAEENL